MERALPRTLSDADRGVNLNSEDGGERGAAPALDVCRDTAGHCVSSPSHARHREHCADDSGSRDMKIERCLEFLRIRHPQVRDGEYTPGENVYPD